MINKKVKDATDKLLELGFCYKSATLNNERVGGPLDALKYSLKLYKDEDIEFEIKSSTLEYLGIMRRSETGVCLDVVLLQDDTMEDFYGWFNVFLTLKFYAVILGVKVKLSHSIKLPFKQYGELKRFVNFIK